MSNFLHFLKIQYLFLNLYTLKLYFKVYVNFLSRYLLGEDCDINMKNIKL